ncbi:RidA family protein [Mesorhizobium sp. M0317]|uniref:RidA family protein n=1 Tax=Mesorhizobium sp. M0317 TaxID=2956935 RepID=UPI00333A3D55
MTQTPEQRLEALDLLLPCIVIPAGNLLGFKIDSDQIFVSSQLPLEDGPVKYVGKVGEAVSNESAYEAAKLAALNVISQLSLATEGDLSKVADIVKLPGFVNCVPDFRVW